MRHRPPTKPPVRRAPAALAIALGAFASLPAAAHPRLEARIARLTELIAASPGDALLHVRRGEIHAEHADWDAAHADYAEARRLAPDLPALELALAETALAMGDPASALRHAGLHLVERPDSVDGLAVRAAARERVGDHAGAAADLARAVTVVERPAPNLFRRWSGALVAAGDPAGAIAALESGLDRLGPLVTLETQALELELGLGRTEAALRRLERLAAGASRPARWHARRGDVLAAAGRRAEAREAYAAALAALRTLSPRAAASSSAAELRRDAEASLAHLGTVESERQP